MTASTKLAKAPPPLDADEALAQLATAASPKDRETLFLVADALKQSRMVRSMAAVVAATEWGAAMSPVRQAAFAKYCLALGADPLRHVDLLGGNPFVNGDYFRDVIAADPDFVRREPVRWIDDDPRLQLCVACGKPFEADVAHGHGIEDVTVENRWRLSERIERGRLRIAHKGTEASPAICLVTLIYKDGRGPFVGIGEVHPGKTAKGNDKDPIGLDSPRGTAETRAWRDAGEQAEATWFRTHASTLKQLETRLKDAYDAEKSVGVAEEPPPAIDAPAAGIEALPAEAPKLTQHEPSKVCPIDGPHADAECGYRRKSDPKVEA